MRIKLTVTQLLSLVAAMLLMASVCAQKSLGNELPSWNDGPNKQRIIDFVRQVTDKGSSDYVPPEDRIATFDNDGTLWVEQPLYTQGIFALDRVKELAPQHPEWKTKMPFSVVLSGNPKAIENLTMKELGEIIAATHSGMTVNEFHSIVKRWNATAKNPHFKYPYTALVYQPMLEVMEYLRSKGFTVYIVTGGGQDFVRVFSKKIYNVEPEQVIGSAGKTKYTLQNNKPVLIKLPQILLIDDKNGKPESINLFIARKPIIAFGNSDGDRQMLEWTQSGKGKRQMFLVHHDDAKREYAYGPESKVGTFSHALMSEAKERNWGIISMKNDWKVIFPLRSTEPRPLGSGVFRSRELKGPTP